MREPKIKASEPLGAADELAKINMRTISIDIPLESENAEYEATTQLIMSALVQIGPGFTATFGCTGYNGAGELIGRFTVINDSYPADKASDTTDRKIRVTTTA
jgi:hypothetical protein